MAAEIYAFVDLFDTAFITAKDPKIISDFDVPNFMFTHSKQLFDAVSKGKTTTKKPLMTDITSVRQSYKEFEIKHVGLVEDMDDPADGMCKIKCNGVLLRILNTGKGPKSGYAVDRSQ